MREIKFRGWHVSKKIMFSAEQMASDQLALLPTGEFINVHGGSKLLSKIYPVDKFIPLQYTGLKDKNGKEIYEGDMVKYCGWIDWLKNTSRKWRVKEVVRDNIVVGFTLGKNQAFTMGESPKYGYEVIGNIYENPELLDVQEGN